MPEALINDWAALGRFSTQGIGGAMGCAVHRSVVQQYVKAWLRERGCLPTGMHRAEGTFQGQTIRFATVFPGKASAALAANGKRLCCDEVWGPPPVVQEGAFGRARRAYRGSPDRARLRAWLLQQVEDALGERE